MFGSRVDGSLRFDTRVDSGGFNTGVKNLGSSLGRLRSSLLRVASAVGLAFSVATVINFGRTCIQTATEVENAWIGLNSIINGQGKSFENAKKFIQEYVSDGLVPLNNAVTAYKNLTLRGYNEEQIKAVMNSLKNSATYARQSQYTLGDAITTATEGLKNENSILVDNAGVTKNVAKMWQDYAKSIGVSSTELTKQQKIQAEVNGILEETKFQMGDAERYSNSYSGQLARLSASFTALKTKIGNILKVIVGNFLPTINNAITAIESLADRVTALFNSWGIQTDVVDSLKGITDIATDSTDSLTDSIDETSEATEKLKNQLASFDKLNVLKQEEEESSSSATTTDLSSATNNINTSVVEQKANKIADIFSSLTYVFDDIKTAFQKAWNLGNLGEKVVQSFKDSWVSAFELNDDIGRTFSEVWNDETGVNICSNILHIVKNINTFVSKISERVKKAWDKNDTGKKIWDDILGIVEDITGLFENLTEITLDWVDRLDFSPLATSTEKLTKAFRKLLKIVGEKLKKAYENILLPLSEWTIEKAVPKLVEALAKALELLAKVIDIIPPNVLNAFASALVAVGAAVLVFKTGQAIASGITAITTALKSFAVLMSSHPVLLIAGVIAGITTAIIAFNKLEWSTSEAAKFAREIDQVKTKLEDSTSAIEETLSNTLSEIDEIYADNTLIDDYQSKLEELISKAELTPEEQSQLQTIVTYFNDNVTGFSDTWDKYVQVSEDGKISLNGDLKEIQDEINNTIDEYQRLASAQVVSDLYTENQKASINAKKTLEESRNAYYKQLEAIGELNKKYEDEYNNGSYLEADNLLKQIRAEEEELQTLKAAYNSNVAAVNKLTMTNDDLLDVQKVLNGDFSDASAVMMAYNAGMINMQDVTESQYKSLDNLQKVAEESGKNLVLGVVEGTEAYKGALVTNSNGWASLILSEFDTAMDMHSPSREMKKRGGFIIEGLIIGVEDKHNKLLKVFERLSTNIKNIFKPIPNWFENIFSTALAGIKAVFSNGINEVIALSFSNLNNAFDSVRNFDIGGFRPFENIATITVPQIPKLATGTVVPANYGEFTAILGDNKREPEIVSPLSTMKQAMKEVLEEMGVVGSFGNVEYRFVAELNGKPIFEEVVTQDKIDRKRHGGRSRLGTVR